MVEELKKELHFESFDDIYEDNATFEEVYETIVNELIQRAQFEDIVYASSGSSSRGRDDDGKVDRI